MADQQLREAQLEARGEAAPFVLVTAGVLILMGLLSRSLGWDVLGRELWWVWLVLAVPELLTALALLPGVGRGRGEPRRHLVIGLIATVIVGSLVGLALMVASLVRYGGALSGAQLLASAAALLFTNVVAFALAFWELDCGGPVARSHARRERPDFQFAQDENPQLAVLGWAPQLLDYAYLSLTNSIAFSPTDVMPLSRGAKTLMALESVLSFGAILVVAARAINILR